MPKHEPYVDSCHSRARPTRLWTRASTSKLSIVRYSNTHLTPDTDPTDLNPTDPNPNHNLKTVGGIADF